MHVCQIFGIERKEPLKGGLFMTGAHWLFLCCIALFLSLMLCFSLLSRPRTRSYRAVSRMFWAAMALLGTQAAGMLALTPLSAAAVAALGAPGLLALLALARL